MLISSSRFLPLFRQSFYGKIIVPTTKLLRRMKKPIRLETGWSVCMSNNENEGDGSEVLLFVIHHGRQQFYVSLAKYRVSVVLTYLFRLLLRDLCATRNNHVLKQPAHFHSFLCLIFPIRIIRIILPLGPIHNKFNKQAISP